MRNFTHRWPKLGHFIPKLGHLFPVFEKGQGRPPLTSYAPGLLLMIDNFWKIQDHKEIFEEVFTNLSKAFDCISHELLIVKLNVYGVDIKSLNFILAYFTNWKQKTKIGSSFSDFLNIVFGVPQCSILGALFLVI